VHMCMYMHMRVRPCTRTCARVCMRMHVHTYARMEGPGGGASACRAVSWARVRTHVYVHACARVYAWARICMGARPTVKVVCTLEQMFWALVHKRACKLHRCVFTSVTHSLQAVYVCVYVYMCVYAYVCVWMRVCVYDIV